MADFALRELTDVRDPVVFVNDTLRPCLSPLAFQKPVAGELRCTCTKTRCLKKYCVCYAAGKACGEQCSCKGCENCDDRDCETTRKKACTCQKSHCLKLYCTCYAVGVPCGTECVCVECKNTAAVRVDRSPAHGRGRGRGHGRNRARRARKRSRPVSLEVFLDEIVAQEHGLNEML